jgi:ABC-type multidrug transport system ATPase subunit
MTTRARRGNISALGLLKPGVTRAIALTELEGIAHRLAVLYPDDNEDRGATIVPIFDSVVSGDLRTGLNLFAAAVGIVLIIACANVANLLLARGTARQKEIAIRSALGGGRWRVAEQLIIESVVLALAGGAAGMVVAIAATDLLVLTAAVRLPRIETIGIDWRVLLFSVGVSILTGITFGIAPTWQALRANIQDQLKEGGGTGSVATSHTAQKVFIIGEVALALVLLLAAGLVLRSTEKALSADPGFSPEHVWFFSVVTSPAEYRSAADTRNFFRRLETRLAATPEVQAVSVALGGLPKPVAVDPDYLQLMGMRLLQGRFFDSRDTQASPPVVVIDEASARARFRDEDPIGRSFVIDIPGAGAIGLDRPRQIVGVVNHLQILGIETNDQLAQLQTQIGFYLPSEQFPDAFAAPLSGMLIKATWPDEKIRDQLERAAHAINPNVEVTGLIKMQDAIAFALVPHRFVTKLLGVFAFTAFVLAAMGIFGIMTYFVSQRTHEIGLRMALGAESGHLVRIVLRQAGLLAGVGIGLGLLCSFGLTRLIGYLLFNISSVDPITYATAVTLLFCTALAAAYIPALRATCLEPVMALKGNFFGQTIQDRNVSHTAGTDSSRHEIPELASNSARAADFAIEVSNLQKAYTTLRGKSAVALSGVSFRVQSGTIFGIIGQNGAGKTTLVKILLGLARPDAGSARLMGCCPGDPIVNRQIGYLPEHMRIPPHFVAENFLRYMGRLNSVGSAALNVRIPELLETVGLGGVHKPVKTYSKGMQQRLGLAQALVNDPGILFLDEPTDGLDPMGRIVVRDLLVRLRAAGKTIFLNSHLLSEVELVCDHIVILNKGVVACTTTPAEFTRGTGEYIMRLDMNGAIATENVQRVVDAVIGPVDWQDGALRFRPRDTAQLNELVDALRAIRVPILSLEPVRLSLEQFFIRVVTEKES